MKFLKERRADQAYSKVRGRLDKVSRGQAVAWANTTLWTVQEGLEHADDRAGLEQAQIGAIALLAALDSLLDRTP